MRHALRFADTAYNNNKNRYRLSNNDHMLYNARVVLSKCFILFKSFHKNDDVIFKNRPKPVTNKVIIQMIHFFLQIFTSNMCIIFCVNGLQMSTFIQGRDNEACFYNDCMSSSGYTNSKLFVNNQNNRNNN